jgi:sugar lactone lactonase YvrE
MVPNGLTLTPDGKTLIVNDNVGDTIYAFDVQRDGTVKANRRLLDCATSLRGKTASETAWRSTGTIGCLRR